ncbi:MAG: hypothetical protein ABI382_03140 [Nakamurella sp.]
MCVLLLAIVGLGAWWWIGRSGVDPIDANPVSASATVMSSPSCLDVGHTTVRVSGVAGVSNLDGCGFAVGQRISVEYLAGHPDVVRLSGTTHAGESSTARKIVPIGILVAGLAAAVGLVAASRAGSKRSRSGAVSVAQLRARMAERGDASAAPASPEQSGQAQ